MIRTLAVAGYRSLRDVRVPLGPLTVITGPNGSGKSNLYRALRLLAEVAQGGALRALAHEGGLESALWAGLERPSPGVLRGELPVEGARRKGPVRLCLGFAGDELGYAIDLGLPFRDDRSAFSTDPEIKREWLWGGPVCRPAALLADRRGPAGRARSGSRGEWSELASDLASFDSLMTHALDPVRAPELLAMREHLRGWRFYDQLRCDAASPARVPQLGTRTPVLASDGSDLAAALQTIIEIGDAPALGASVSDAFPGAQLRVEWQDGRFEVQLEQRGLLRPLRAAELSDGTLRYLLWIAALHTPRPPGLLVMNEPETSLHVDLLPALGRLIGRACERAQIVVVTHAPRLVEALAAVSSVSLVALEKELGETRIVGQGLVDRPPWQWPAR